MPHQSTDDYITQFATLMHQKDNSNLRLHVEYSNETWNGAFNQTSYMTSQGQALWPTAQWFAANRDYYGMRVAQTGAYTNSGSWGALENIMDTSSPKYDGLINFIDGTRCWWSGCTGP
jgi:hypothetical protein